MDKAEILQKAQAALRERGRPVVAASPLADMAAWIEAGAPPPAAHLRAQGFTGRAAAEGPDAERLREVRKAFTRLWGFSIPCAEAVAALRGLAPLVEIGAGTGYWSALLRAAGHDVIATDVQAAGEGPYGSGLGRCLDLEAMDAATAVERHPARDVFCSWPTEGADWAYEAATRVRRGRVFALIGDPAACATPALYDLLARDFEPVAEVALPQFPRVDDRLTLSRRR
jgi:hypothetical protein